VHSVNELMKKTSPQRERALMQSTIVLTLRRTAAICRKPKTSLLERAAREHLIELSRSFVVGDRYGDIELARNVRARGISSAPVMGRRMALAFREMAYATDFVAESFESGRWILRQLR